jgi:hypothetical protein
MTIQSAIKKAIDASDLAPNGEVWAREIDGTVTAFFCPSFSLIDRLTSQWELLCVASEAKRYQLTAIAKGAWW